MWKTISEREYNHRDKTITIKVFLGGNKMNYDDYIEEIKNETTDGSR